MREWEYSQHEKHIIIFLGGKKIQKTQKHLGAHMFSFIKGTKKFQKHTKKQKNSKSPLCKYCTHK